MKREITLKLGSCLQDLEADEYIQTIAICAGKTKMMINSRVDENGNYHQIYPPRQLYMPPQGAKVEVLMNWAGITRPTFYLMHAFFEKAGLSK